MAHQSSAAAMIEDMRSRGLTTLGDVDETAVETFLADITSDIPVANLIQVRDRMVSMIQRREKARGTNLPTMAATADRITAIIEQRS